ncbi:protein serine/threonine phosphatase 2C [Rhizopus microsporus var. microsporus]|uniref:Protein phosphatase n=2 Tax=Rhizopus microsporus TaxID=58291 RepID=A0A2G4SQB3_RHIZD|nr:protein serine/threonine phosphatase 2C [Rhizopus microsporus ATCC 52813]ORE05292.1 protein serine/threonine phosphatase 2C [Rhizopus microsporus var. microsporus]PHZ10953.1 protein serine/threonine phosphatase 2C [Rhizopus microsporus ATCC 52813]
MKPHIQRIAAASLLLRSSRPLWTTAVTHSKPAICQHLPYCLQVQQQQQQLISQNDLTSRHFTTASTTAPVTTNSVEEGKHEPVPEPFHFIAYAAWHPKTKQRTNQSKVPYWKQIHRTGKVDAGEDAFFQTTTPEGLAIGVADGVGGWSTVGVDPALFSWTLMDNAAMIAKHEKVIDAHQILDAAFHELRKSGKVAAGSSTACILNLSKTTGEMTSCNLGDSAFLLVRDKKIVYESPSQQHYFNCPYQLTVVPESYPNRDALVTDLPKDADTKKFYLKNGDLILLATDGYFDNMYSEETLEIINAGMESIEGKDPDMVKATIRRLAKTLTEKARRQSLDPKRLSPWAKAAQAHGSNYRGGKVDDITCIVTLVCHNKM